MSHRFESGRGIVARRVQRSGRHEMHVGAKGCPLSLSLPHHILSIGPFSPLLHWRVVHYPLRLWGRPVLPPGVSEAVMKVMCSSPSQSHARKGGVERRQSSCSCSSCCSCPSCSSCSSCSSSFAVDSMRWRL